MASTALDKKSAKTTSVSVSTGLQKVLLATLLASVLGQMFTMVWLYGFNPATYSISYATHIIVISLFPIPVFVTAYALAGRYAEFLPRAFMAALYTLVTWTALGFLLGLKNTISMMVVPRISPVVPPPSWLTSQTGDYVILAVVFIVFVVVAVRQTKG